MKRIYVDTSRCEGSQLCVAAYPEAFAYGDDGYGHVTDEEWADGLSEDEREDVMMLCPASAIRLREDAASAGGIGDQT